MNCQSSENIDQDRSAKAPTAAAAPPIDREALLSRCMGSMDLADALLRRFASQGRQEVEAIAQHAGSDQPAAAGEAAHALKGAAATICAESLSAKAAEIETAGREGEIGRVRSLMDELGDEMDRCLAYIPALRGAAE